MAFFQYRPSSNGAMMKEIAWFIVFSTGYSLVYMALVSLYKTSVTAQSIKYSWLGVEGTRFMVLFMLHGDISDRAGGTRNCW